MNIRKKLKNWGSGVNAAFPQGQPVTSLDKCRVTLHQKFYLKVWQGRPPLPDHTRLYRNDHKVSLVYTPYHSRGLVVIKRYTRQTKYREKGDNTNDKKLGVKGNRGIHATVNQRKTIQNEIGASFKRNRGTLYTKKDNKDNSLKDIYKTKQGYDLKIHTNQIQQYIKGRLYRLEVRVGLGLAKIYKRIDRMG